MRGLSRSAFVGLLASGALLLAGATGMPTRAAHADTSTPVVDAAAESSWQTGGTVWALATAGGRLFAGGDFTTTRPPGVAAGGAGEVTRSHLAAYDAGTGALDTAFNHNVAGRIWAMAVSPDARTLYVGGEFNAVDGQPRGRVAAFDLSTPGGTLLPFDPKAGSGAVRSLAVSSDSVYVGGTFQTLRGVSSPFLAALDLSGNQRAGWSASVDGGVLALLVAPSQDRLIVGGSFNNANGAPHRALASMSTATGASLPMDQGLIPPCTDSSCTRHSDVKTLVTDGSRVLVGAEGTGSHWFDGTLAVDPLSGHAIWTNRCYGATQAITALQGVLYIGSHAHDCSVIGGFGQAPFQSGPSSWHHLMAQRVSDGALLSWFPSTNPGPTNGQSAGEVGPRALTNDGSTIFVGGQFTTVNGKPQQGLTRFTPGADATAPSAPRTVTATSPAPGSVLVRWGGATDPDDGLLSYRVYRDGALVATVPATRAAFWLAVQSQFRDSAAAAGTHRYAVEAVDASGRPGPRGSVSVTTATTRTGGYRSAVSADRPAQWWRLDEKSGTTVADSSGSGITGTTQPGTSLGRPGPWPTTTAAALGTGSITSNGAAVAAPSPASTELWFRTTSATGGRIAGWGNQRTSTSSQFDRLVWMNNAGQVLFGVYVSGWKTAWTPRSYNDGSWHHLVATVGQSGLLVYVDGVAAGQQAGTSPVTAGAAYSGYFRLGVDTLRSVPQAPSSAVLNGDVAQVALYGQALSATQVRAHYGQGD